MFLKRLVGFLLIIAAAAGVVFSIVGLVEIWRYRPVVSQAVTDNLALMDQALIITQDGLTIVGQVMQTTTADVASLQTTTQAVARAIHDTNPMLTALTTLTGNDFPAAISATKTSLASAENSALLIDNVLAVLTSFPLSPVAAYKPAVPLHTALAQVSTSLNSLPPSLAAINSSLADGKANLGVVEVQLNKISDTTKEMSTALGNAQTVVSQYQAVTTQLRAQVEAAQRAAPGWLMAITWILTFVLAWLLIVQLGLAVQGLDMVRGRRDPK
jgi:hypothetical protein